MLISGIISLVDLTAGLRGGDIPLLDYLDQLEAQFDAYESQVQAFVPEAGRFARLRKEAEQLLDRYPRPSERPALFGVPIGVKDIYHVDGFVTRAGSRLDSDLIQGEESAAIRQMKEAGALILGKTVTTEFGPDPQSAQPGTHAGWVQQRFSSGRRCRALRAGIRDTDHRIHQPARGLLRRRRLQTEPRPDQQGRRHSRFSGGRSCWLFRAPGG